MKDMIFTLLALFITFFGGIGLPSIIICSKLIKEQKRKNDIREMEITNERYRLYTDIDLPRCEEAINEILKFYLDRWVLTNITINGQEYIKSDQVDELIKYIVIKFISEMSDIHLFYIKCITNIDDDESLTRWVRNKTKLIVLDFITEFNQVQ